MRIVLKGEIYNAVFGVLRTYHKRKNKHSEIYHRSNFQKYMEAISIKGIENSIYILTTLKNFPRKTHSHEWEWPNPIQKEIFYTTWDDNLFEKIRGEWGGERMRDRTVNRWERGGERNIIERETDRKWSIEGWIDTDTDRYRKRGREGGEERERRERRER